jgi:hypothetical protein
LNGFRLVDRHPEAAFDQLVGRTHPAHPAPEHSHARRRAPPRRARESSAGDVVGVHRCPRGVSTCSPGTVQRECPRQVVESRARRTAASMTGGQRAWAALSPLGQRGACAQEAHMRATTWSRFES